MVSSSRFSVQGEIITFPTSPRKFSLHLLGSDSFVSILEQIIDGQRHGIP